MHRGRGSLKTAPSLCFCPSGAVRMDGVGSSLLGPLFPHSPSWVIISLKHPLPLSSPSGYCLPFLILPQHFPEGNLPVQPPALISLQIPGQASPCPLQLFSGRSLIWNIAGPSSSRFFLLAGFGALCGPALDSPDLSFCANRSVTISALASAPYFSPSGWSKIFQVQ